MTKKTTAPASGNSTPPVRSEAQLRLVITIPAALLLFVVSYGLISYLALTHYWEELYKAGNAEVARSLLNIHMLAMVALALLGALLGVALALAIQRPIQAIVEATQKIAQGSLDQYAAQVPAARELGDLSRSFNQMIDNLKKSIDLRDRQLMENIPTAVLTVDLEGRLHMANHVAAQILGLDLSSWLGRPLAELAHELAGPPLTLVRILDQTVRKPQPAREFQIPPTSQDPYGGYVVGTSFERDAQGQAVGVIFLVRPSAQVDELSDHLRRTDQLAAMGAFSMGLAHELRNPLGAVKGLSQLLLMDKAGLPTSTAEYLERMNREVDRVDTFVRKLLDLASQPIAPPQPTQAATLFFLACDLLRDKVREKKALGVNVHESYELSSPIWVEADRMAQALAKILDNALEAAGPGATVTLGARRGLQGQSEVDELYIHNTGQPIPAEHLGKILDPFFTTRERATGLGLTIANQIIHQNGGTLTVQNDPQGVAFILRFQPRGGDPSTSQQGATAR